MSSRSRPTLVELAPHVPASPAPASRLPTPPAPLTARRLAPLTMPPDLLDPPALRHLFLAAAWAVIDASALPEEEHEGSEEMMSEVGVRVMWEQSAWGSCGQRLWLVPVARCRHLCHVGWVVGGAGAVRGWQSWSESHYSASWVLSLVCLVRGWQSWGLRQLGVLPAFVCVGTSSHAPAWCYTCCRRRARPSLLPAASSPMPGQSSRLMASRARPTTPWAGPARTQVGGCSSSGQRGLGCSPLRFGLAAYYQIRRVGGVGGGSAAQQVVRADLLLCTGSQASCMLSVILPVPCCACALMNPLSPGGASDNSSASNSQASSAMMMQTWMIMEYCDKGWVLTGV